MREMGDRNDGLPGNSSEFTRLDQRRLATVNSISRILFYGGDLASVLQKVAPLIAELLSVDVVLIYVLQEKARDLELVAHRGLSFDAALSLNIFKNGEGPYFRVVQTGVPEVLRIDTNQSAFSQFGLSHIRVQLVVPLIMRSRVSGIVCAGSFAERDFPQSDVDLLSAVGIQIAMAIENTRLQEEQQRITGRLAVSENAYRWLFENASDAIWVNDYSGNIIMANRAAAELVGDNINEMIGSNVRQYLTEKGLASARRIRDFLLSGQPFEQPYEQRIIRKDGSELILMVTTSIVKSEDSPPVFEHIARDVTKERRMQENLKYFFQQITRSQEEERKRIARELHDDTAQALYALTRQVDYYLRTAANLLPDTVEFLRGLRDQIRSVSQGVRRFSQDLRPPLLDDLGLLTTLRWMVNDIKERCGIDAQLELIGGERRLEPDVELAIFRICQEALRNVEKHSAATKVEVKVAFNAWSLQIFIVDNGKGFNMSKELSELPREGRLGLVGMEERARLLGGTISIHSAINQGTRVVIKLPV